MTTLPSSSTPTRTGEVCSPPLDLRVVSTARWLLATNSRASSGLIRLLCRRTQLVTYCAPFYPTHGGLRRIRQSDGSRARGRAHHPPGCSPAHRADPIANDRTPCARASTNHPAPASSASGGHPPIGPGRSGGGARCRPIRPAPRSSDAPPGPSAHAHRAAPPAGSRRRGRRHSSPPRPGHARGHLPASSGLGQGLELDPGLGFLLPGPVKGQTARPGNRKGTPCPRQPSTLPAEALPAEALSALPDFPTLETHGTYRTSSQ